jgi:Uma2 family endonuclease
MGMAVPIYFTAEMVRALPDDGKRYETVHGELLVTPAPRWLHQELVGRIFERLRAYVRQEPAGHVVLSPADISWGPDVLVQPDVFVVPVDQARTGDWARMTNLLLVVEVLSPSTSRADRFAKRRLYQEVGVPLYWIVDGEEARVEVWAPHVSVPAIESERLVWQPPGCSTAFTLELTELFRPLEGIGTARL